MRQLRPNLLLDSDLVHCWGAAGSGKTLFACLQAAEYSRSGTVEWINTDGKVGFLSALKATTRALGGDPSRISITVANGHRNALKAVRRAVETIAPDTNLLIVDPITRVIDMSREEDVLWGREMIEEVLPSLVSQTEIGVRVLLVSEVRYLDVGVLPVMYDTISRWKPLNLHMARGPGRYSTISIPAGPDEEVVAIMRLGKNGVINVTAEGIPPECRGGDTQCLESQSFV